MHLQILHAYSRIISLDTHILHNMLSTSLILENVINQTTFLHILDKNIELFFLEALFQALMRLPNFNEK